MNKKTKKIIEEKVEEKEEMPREESPQGREENFFFPREMKTIKATSLKEAIKKLKERE